MRARSWKSEYSQLDAQSLEHSDEGARGGCDESNQTHHEVNVTKNES